MRYFLTTIIVSLIFVYNILAQDYAVQVAAYSDPVTLERFEDLPGVYQEQDHNNIYRYYLGPYVTEDFAEKVKKKALKAGFPYSRVVNLTQILSKHPQNHYIRYVQKEPHVDGCLGTFTFAPHHHIDALETLLLPRFP